MEILTMDKLLEHYTEGHVFDVTLDGEDDLAYAEEVYCARVPMRFVAFLGNRGQIVTYQSLDGKDQWHSAGDAGWLLKKILDGTWKK